MTLELAIGESVQALALVAFTQSGCLKFCLEFNYKQKSRAHSKKFNVSHGTQLQSHFELLLL